METAVGLTQNFKVILKFSINTYLCICIGVGVVQDKVAEMSLEGKVGQILKEYGIVNWLFFECSRM